MKKLTVLSIVAASLLLVVGCNESSTGAEARAAGEAKIEAPAHAEKTAMKCASGKCGGDMKKAATEAKEEVKSAATEAKEAAEKAVEKTGEAVAEKVAEVKEAVTEKAAAAVAGVAGVATAAVEKTKEAASAVAEKATEAVAAATGGAEGKALFAKCAGCHGADGKTKALGKSGIIAGQSAGDLETKINGYKAGTLNTAGMGALMKGQVASMSDADIKAVAAYISGL